MNNQNLTELKNRDLDSCYFFLYCIPNKIYLDEGNNRINEKEIYTFIGCNTLGVRKFITSVEVSKFPKASNWYDLFQSIKTRKLESILYAVIPDNKTLKDALRIAFPGIEFFLSCFESINKIQKYFPIGYTSNVLDDIKNIYISKNIDEFNIQKKEFNDKYSESIFIIELLENDFKTVEKYFKYDFFLRKHIFAFYFIREFTKKTTVLSHSQPHFNNVDEFAILVVPYIQSFEKRMYCSKNEWLSIINMLYENKKDMLIKYL